MKYHKNKLTCMYMYVYIGYYMRSSNTTIGPTKLTQLQAKLVECSVELDEVGTSYINFTIETETT